MFVIRKYLYIVFSIVSMKLIFCKEHCTTPDGHNGECIPLKDCYISDHIVDGMPSKRKNFIRASFCGIRDGQVYVCCDLLPFPPNCGNFLTNRIYDGNETRISEYPWVVLLIYEGPKNEIDFFCGGSLLNNRYVLTAAHCVYHSKITDGWRLTKVRLGEWDTSMDPDYVIGINGIKDEAEPHVEVSIEKSIVHPDYERVSKNRLNDIALLRLESKVAFSQYIQPICLPSQKKTRNDPFTNATADVAGWGATEKLSASPIKLKTTLNVVDFTECKQSYALADINLSSSQICAGGKKGVDSCFGDSGGPLAIEGHFEQDSNCYYVIGLVSFGSHPCGEKGWPGVYTRVGAYMEWIASNIEL